MARFPQKKLEKFAKGFKVGGMVSFTRVDNARRFAKLQRERSFKTETIRSFGPTVEGDRSRKAHTVILVKKVRKVPVRKFKRRKK